MKIKTPESGVLKACLDLLAAERIWHRRWNSGAIQNAKGRPVKFGQKGDADIVCTPRTLDVPYFDEFGERKTMRHIDGPPCILWVECKSDSGSQTKEQKGFQRQVEEAGHFYIVVRSSDDLLAWIKEHR